METNGMSIDTATPEEWDALRNKDRTKSAKFQMQWHDDVEEDDMPNEHPLFSDEVNKPQHYNNGSIECIEAIEGMLTPEEYIGYLRGNTLKYQWRCRYKGHPVVDLRKARWYEERLINYILENPSVI